MTGLFLDGPIMLSRDRRGRVEVRRDDNDDGVTYDGPLAILVSRQSASASEILAMAIQDYRRGVVIGDSQTFGKGSAFRAYRRCSCPAPEQRESRKAQCNRQQVLRAFGPLYYAIGIGSLILCCHLLLTIRTSLRESSLHYTHCSETQLRPCQLSNPLATSRRI